MTEPGIQLPHPRSTPVVTHHLDVHQMVALAVPVNMLLVAGWKERYMGAIDSTHCIGDGCDAVESTFNLIPFLTRQWHVDVGGRNCTESLQHSFEDTGKGHLRHANNIPGHHLVESLAKKMEYGEQLCHAQYGMTPLGGGLQYKAQPHIQQKDQLLGQPELPISVKSSRRVAKCFGAITRTLLLLLRCLLSMLNCNKLHSNTFIAGKSANPTLSLSSRKYGTGYCHQKAGLKYCMFLLPVPFVNWTLHIYTHPHIGMHGRHPCTVYKYTHAPKGANPKKNPAAKSTSTAATTRIMISRTNRSTHHAQCDTPRTTDHQAGPNHTPHTYGHIHKQTMCKDGAQWPTHGSHQEANHSSQHKQGHPYWHPHRPSKNHINSAIQGGESHPPQKYTAHCRRSFDSEDALP